MTQVLGPNYHNSGADGFEADQFGPALRIKLYQVKAVISDLDGVISNTSKLHEDTWALTFNYMLNGLGLRSEAFRPFTHDEFQLLNGNGRFPLIVSFLRSRGFLPVEDAVLPATQVAAARLAAAFSVSDLDQLFQAVGDRALQLLQDFRAHRGAEAQFFEQWGPDAAALHQKLAAPAALLVYAIGAVKDTLVKRRLQNGEIEAYPHTIKLIQQLEAADVPIKVASSSKNCGIVLGKIGLERLAQDAVDGRERERLKLPNKPAPDIYLEACRRAGVHPHEAVLLEDAAIGVAAGKKGGFGLVVGLDRNGDRTALLEAGAHVVIKDISDLGDDPFQELNYQYDYLHGPAISDFVFPRRRSRRG